MNDLIAKCVAEEEKLKNEKNALALLSVHSKPRFGKNNWKNKNSSHASHKGQDVKKPGTSHHNFVGDPNPNAFKKPNWCFFCKEKGHKKHDCAKLKAYLENKQKSEGVQKPERAQSKGKNTEGRK